ncbi:unnamed protein product, partial [Meganyctiphanes norvegica]
CSVGLCAERCNLQIEESLHHLLALRYIVIHTKNTEKYLVVLILSLFLRKMCVLRATNCLYVILASFVFLFNIIQYSAVTGSPVASSILTSNLNYIEIDHELVPRTIENINDMSPLPVPPGRNNSEMRKFPVSKRQIQRIILE